MKILVTGARGFVGRNLVETLKAVRDGKDRTRGVLVEEIYAYDLDTDPTLLEEFCAKADFVFNLAGVNRPKEQREFMEGNFGFASTLLETLKHCGNRCPVMLSSSIQASLTGRYAGSAYGKSKLAGEELFFQYGRETGAPVLVYRFPNLFGKWCRPNYNSVVATFCHNIARGLPITVSDPAAELTLAYVDDVVDELFRALRGEATREGRYCTVPVTHTVTLEDIISLLETFHSQPQTLLMPEMPAGSFAKKLYATYLSYLPPEAVAIPLTMHTDARGSFTEVLKTSACGQVSVNITKPGVTKGQHWHHSKWEFFLVVAGRGLIREREIGGGEVLEFPVSGENLQAVHMLPGYTHSLINLSQTEDLVTVMWANEPFDPQRPDTYFEEV